MKANPLPEDSEEEIDSGQLPLRIALLEQRKEAKVRTIIINLKSLVGNFLRSLFREK